MSVLISNKKVHFNYEILEKFEAGIELFGFEVKALRSGQGNLEGGHVSIRGGEAFLIGVQIPPYQSANTPKNYEPERVRKLLLTKAEIGKLAENESKKGLTIVPISVYNKGRKIKLEIAVVRGKKRFDKRETIKRRDTEREIRRTLKNQ
ncbi:MAG TPA: SsrA-binding protein SmpB [Candidatus Paceibacterota bacterium]|nr:SsrA-binding protein SmpB [Candidatus Paceibacterota bacterium]